MAVINRIKELFQEYKTGGDLDKLVAEAIDLAQPPACLSTNRKITCQEMSCVGCPVRRSAVDLVEKALRICPKCGADRENYQEMMRAPCCEG